MANPIFRILTHPRLERYRARIPYPAVVGMICLIVFGSISAVLLALSATSARTGGNLASDISPLTPILLGTAYTGLFVLSAISGFISGYRPFVHRWQNVCMDDIEAIGSRLAVAAEGAGFQIVWRGPHGGFCGVRSMELEGVQYINSATHFPMRLSFFVRTAGAARADAVMKLQNRTVVVWDTGERACCRGMGEALLRGDGEATALHASPQTTDDPV